MTNRIVSAFLNTSTPRAELVGADGQTLRVLHAPIKNVRLVAILQQIQAGKWREAVERYRASGLGAHKKDLPAFTPAGTFLVRVPYFFDACAQQVVIDYDGLTADVAASVRQLVGRDPHVVAAFISPSGRGVKVLVAVGYFDATTYAQAFKRAARYVDELVGIDHDRSGDRDNDVGRLCFVSYDPDLVYNPQAVALAAPNKPSGPALADPEAADVVAFTARLAGEYAPGNRNEFLYRLGCNCNRRGFDFDAARNLLVAVWQTDPEGLPESELLATLKSAYRRTHEHNAYPRRQPVARG